MVNEEAVVQLGINYAKAIGALKRITKLDPGLWQTGQRIATETLKELGEEDEMS